MSSPAIVCIACNTREVGIYELVCSDCRQVAEQLGLVKPQTPPNDAPDQRIQIGPTDV